MRGTTCFFTNDSNRPETARVHHLTAGGVSVMPDAVTISMRFVPEQSRMPVMRGARSASFTLNRERAMLFSRLLNPRHLLGATRHSLAGLVRAWQGEQAFRHEVGVLAILLLALVVTGKDVGDGLLVIGGWLGVMVVELLNSAVEEAFDLISTEWNARIKAGKDMASAAIFVAMIVNAGIWLRVFFL